MTRSSLIEIPTGVQCFFGDEARLRREVERTVVEVFCGWSYEEVVLPLFDFDEVFTRGGGPISRAGTYRFIGRNGEILALRPDFTALVAKVVASRLWGLELPLRLFYTGEVLRYQPPRAGKQEELFQIGLEHFGDGVDADVEVLLVAFEALDRLGVHDAVVTLGHVGVVLPLLSGAENRAAALDAVRRHDKEALARAVGDERSRPVLELMGLSGKRDVLDEALSLADSPALRRLEAIASRIEELGFGERVRFDFAEVRGFDYYTGYVFEVHAPGAGLELGGGGRYDSLVGRFGRDLPAVGFYLSLDRLAELLEKRGYAPRPVDEAEGLPLREALAARRVGRRVRVTEV
ncbi:MAG TPA: ATP phosphoribosyltransferase regulatory subunit [Vicinamibacteria bacterium]|nr:ATP phosphoribosyltransferase regulatory subunit [Vicinamibacteria bacterium]